MKAFVLIATLLALSQAIPAADIHLAKGLHTGDVTSTSVILHDDTDIILHRHQSP